MLAKAQRACCPEVERAFRLPLLVDFDTALIGMFKAEWARQRGDTVLRRIAIIDDNPESQYLYPEFLLARETFRRHGLMPSSLIPLRFTMPRVDFGSAAARSTSSTIVLSISRLISRSMRR